MTLNKDGFYRPILVDDSACNNCGLCDKVCVKGLEVKEVDVSQAYSCATQDKDALATTSSGGLCYELAKSAIQKGKKVCACVYDYDNHVAKHAIIDSIDQLDGTKGSKYMQSNTVEGFTGLFDGSEYVVFGTPCQISAIRNILELKKLQDKFLLVDFFCHGTPSMNLWKKYISENDSCKINRIEFRSKEFGWGRWSLKFEYSDGTTKSDSNGNMFYNFFFGNNCLNDSCYECSHKMLKSNADIRVGDFWGKKYADNKIGISSCLAITQKGKDAIQDIAQNMNITTEDTNNAVEGQMFVCPKKNGVRKSLLKALRGRRKLTTINKTTMFPYRVKMKVKSLIRRGK